MSGKYSCRCRTSSSMGRIRNLPPFSSSRRAAKIVAALAALVASVGYYAARRISASFFKDSGIALGIVSIGLALLISVVCTQFILLPYVFIQLGPI